MFVELADTFVDEFDAIEFLHDLARHAARVSGAEAVGVMLELLHLQADEGPCIDCFISREPVVNADIATAGDLWPRALSRSSRAPRRRIPFTSCGPRLAYTPSDLGQRSGSCSLASPRYLACAVQLLLNRAI